MDYGDSRDTCGDWGSSPLFHLEQIFSGYRHRFRTLEEAVGQAREYLGCLNASLDEYLAEYQPDILGKARSLRLNSGTSANSGVQGP